MLSEDLYNRETFMNDIKIVNPVFCKRLVSDVKPEAELVYVGFYFSANRKPNSNDVGKVFRTLTAKRVKEIIAFKIVQQ